MIPSPSTLVKIQTMGGKVCLRCKGKTLLGVVDKLLKTILTITACKLHQILKKTRWIQEMLTRQQSNNLEAASLQSIYHFSFICQTFEKVQFVMPIKIAYSNGNLNCNTYLQYIHSPKSHFFYIKLTPLSTGQ